MYSAVEAVLDLSSPSVWITYSDALSIEVLLNPPQTVEAAHVAARTKAPTVSADGRWIYVAGARSIDALRLRIGPLDHPPGTLLSVTGAPYRWRPFRPRLEQVGVTTLVDPTPATIQDALKLANEEMPLLYAPYDSLGIPRCLVTARIGDVISLLTAVNCDVADIIRIPSIRVNRRMSAPIEVIRAGQLPLVEQHFDPDLFSLEQGVFPPWRS